MNQVLLRQVAERLVKRVECNELGYKRAITSGLYRLAKRALGEPLREPCERCGRVHRDDKTEDKCLERHWDGVVWKENHERRANRIVALRNAGYTWKQIGEEVGRADAPHIPVGGATIAVTYRSYIRKIDEKPVTGVG